MEEWGGNESRTETDCRVRSGRRHGGFQRTGWSKSRPRRKRRGVVTTERDLIFVDRRVGQKGWTEGGQSRGHRSFRLFLLE